MLVISVVNVLKVGTLLCLPIKFCAFFKHYLQALSVFCAVDCVIVNSVLHCALNQTGLGVDWRPDLTATKPTLVKTAENTTKEQGLWRCTVTSYLGC